MFSQQIDFYIDEKNQVIPASIAILEEVETNILAASAPAERRYLTRPDQQSQRGRFWFWLALLLGGATAFGSVWFNQRIALTAALSPTEQAPQPMQFAVALRSDPAPTRPSDSALLQSAQTAAKQAVTMAHAARSIDDWRLVANRWKQAIDRLSSISSSSPQAALAAQKLRDYHTALSEAQQRGNQPVVEAPLPSTTIILTKDVSCSAQTAGATSAGLEITNVSFDQSKTSRSPAYLVGCISNHTNQTITQISIAYKGNSTQSPSLFQAGNEGINITKLEPGQTLPFRSRFSINPLINSVSVQSIFWTPQGTAQPQSVSTSVEITR